MIFALLGIAMLLTLVWLWRQVDKAPTGHQDEDGYHSDAEDEE